MDRALLEVLNGMVAATPRSFDAALGIGQNLMWLLFAIVLTHIWFSGNPGVSATQVGYRSLVGNRRRVVLMMLALLLGLIYVALLHVAFFRVRPLVDELLRVPVLPEAWQILRLRYSPESAFVDEQAVLLGILLVNILLFNRRMLLFVAGLGFLILGARIGLGLHWPTDAIAGLALGMLLASLCIAIESRIRPHLNRAIYLYEYHPVLLYGLSVLLMVDLMQQFQIIGSALRGILPS